MQNKNLIVGVTRDFCFKINGHIVKVRRAKPSRSVMAAISIANDYSTATINTTSTMAPAFRRTRDKDLFYSYLDNIYNETSFSFDLHEKIFDSIISPSEFSYHVVYKDYSYSKYLTNNYKIICDDDAGIFYNGRLILNAEKLGLVFQTIRNKCMCREILEKFLDDQEIVNNVLFELCSMEKSDLENFNLAISVFYWG